MQAGIITRLWGVPTLFCAGVRGPMADECRVCSRFVPVYRLFTICSPKLGLFTICSPYWFCSRFVHVMCWP